MAAQETNNSKTRLLLHLDGEDGSSAIVDSAVGSIATHSFETGGRLSDEQVKFGVTSLRCYGVNGGVRVAGAPDWNFGRSAWTMDCWIYPIGGEVAPFCFWKDDNNYFGFVSDGVEDGDTAKVRLAYKLNGKMIEQAAVARDILPLNQWTHVVLTRRTGPDMSVVAATTGSPANLALSSAAVKAARLDFAAWPLYFGAGPAYGKNRLGFMDGFIDEARVHNEYVVYSGVLAELGNYDLPLQQYARVFTLSPSGRHHVFNSGYQMEGAGRHLVGGKSIIIGGTGRHNVRNSVQAEGAGVHTVLNQADLEGTGQHSVIDVSEPQLRTFRSTPIGSHGVYNARNAQGTGHYTILDLQITVGGSGQHTIRNAFTIGGSGQHDIRTAIEAEGTGLHAVKASQTTYQLYYAFGSPPDLDGAPWETFSSLPHETAVAITGEGLHYFVLRVLNDFGLESQNLTATIIELDASDTQLVVRPIPPTDPTVSEIAGSKVRVTANYRYIDDGNAGDTFEVYMTTNGTDPDPDIDTPTSVSMMKADGTSHLRWDSASVGDGVTVKIIVRVARASDGRESSNLDIVSLVTSAAGPAAPDVQFVQSSRQRRGIAIR